MHEVSPRVDVAGHAVDPRQIARRRADSEVVAQRLREPQRFSGQFNRPSHIAGPQRRVRLGTEREGDENPVASAEAPLEACGEEWSRLLVAVAVGQHDALEDHAEVGTPRVIRGISTTPTLHAQRSSSIEVDIEVEVGRQQRAPGSVPLVTVCGRDREPSLGRVDQQLPLSADRGNESRANEQPRLDGGSIVGSAPDRLLQILDALVSVPVHEPQSAQRGGQAPAPLGVRCRQSPAQGGAKVVVLDLQPGQPGVLVGTLELGLGPLGEIEEVLEMPVPALLGLAGGVQAVQRVLADRLLEPVAAAPAVVLVGENERLVHESAECVERIAGVSVAGHTLPGPSRA